MALPIGWTAADFSAWVDPILADCAAERIERIYARTPVPLRANMAEYLATGTTVSPLPSAWTVLEFTDWAAGLVAAADADYVEDIYSKVPDILRVPVQDYISADPPAQQWSDAVLANGGTISPARRSIVQNFIAAEMAAGTWALTDDYWCLWAENPVQALTSIKQRRLATAAASPVFLPNRHYEFNGTSSYIDTGFIPSTHAVAMTGTSLRLAAYERSNILGTNNVAAVAETATRNLSLGPRTGSSLISLALDSAFATLAATVADSRGFTAISRTSADLYSGYKNGVLHGTVVPGSSATTLPTRSLYIGAANNTGVAGNFRAAAAGFVCTGAALTPAQEAAQFNNIQGWAIAVGAAAVGQDDTTLWANAVIANGGTVSTTRRAQVANLIDALEAAGTWPLIDDAWLIAAENQPQALTSLKQRRLAVAVAAPAFTPDRGYAFAATTYVDTLFTPSINAVAMTGTSLHIAVYERTNLASGTLALGAINSSTQNLQINPRTPAGQLSVQLDSQANGPGGDISADSRGLSVGSRNGTLAADVLAYKNGVAVLPYAPGTVGAVLPTVKLFIGNASNSSNMPGTSRPATEAFVSVGAAIPAAQQPAFYSAIQSHMTAIGAQVVSDPDVGTWASAVLANGGTVSTARLDLVIALVKAWKAAGVWSLIDDAWLLVAENSQQALTSLKQLRLATAVAAPTFTVDRGYAFNGTTQYLDTLFTPSTNAVAMTGTSLHIAVYERTNMGAANTTAAGAINFSTQTLAMFPKSSGGQMLVQLDSQGVGPGGDVQADSRGLSVGSRNGTLAADILAYKNGVAVLPYAPGTLGSALPTVKIFIGANANNSNVAASFRAATEGFVSVGAAIPAASQPAFYSALQTYMAAVGASV